MSNSQAYYKEKGISYVSSVEKIKKKVFQVISSDDSNKDYIEPLQRFFTTNKNHREVGDYKRSESSFSFETHMHIDTNEKAELPEFITDDFAKILFQIAINLSPLRTGNLARNMGYILSNNGTKFEIIYNKFRNAEYTYYLNRGNSKWRGFIEYTRQVIEMMIALYFSGNLTRQEMLFYAQGIKGNVSRPKDAPKNVRTKWVMNVDEPVVYASKTQKMTGWERQTLRSLGYSNQQIKQMNLGVADVANIDILRNPNVTTKKLDSRIMGAINVDRGKYKHRLDSFNMLNENKITNMQTKSTFRSSINIVKEWADVKVSLAEPYKTKRATQRQIAGRNKGLAKIHQQQKKGK